MKLSVVIIAKNAQEQIVKAIESVSFADEIVVVDSGSRDSTVNVAKKMRANVYVYESDNFSDIRNYGLEKAKEDWIFYVDSDEVVSKELAEDIKKHINANRENSVAYNVIRKNFYLGNNEWPHQERLTRLFRKNVLKRWEGRLHESPIFDGKAEDMSGYLLHYSHRDLASMLAKTILWSKTEADLRVKAHHPKMTWWRFPRVMLTAFFDSYIAQRGLKAGTVGLIESIYQSFSMFVTYARVWEMQQKSVDPKKR